MKAPGGFFVPRYSESGDELLYWTEEGDELTELGEQYVAQCEVEDWEAWAPRRFRAAHLNGIADDVLPDVERWIANVNDGQPSNLLVLGPVGTGKTHLALAVARRFRYDNRKVAFFPVVDMLDNLRPNGAPAVDEWGNVGAGAIAYYAKPDVLVLDDLGGEKASDWTFERLYAVVNKRWLDEKPTIATTNLEPAELREAVGARTYDRLRDGAVAIHLGGESRRRPA